jgi:Zn-dependent protease
MIAHLLVWYIVFLFSVTFHEFAHARAAAALGDKTAYWGGYTTLDPTPHLKRSPFGLIFIPILTYIQMHWMMGWASVPFDSSWGKRHPLGMAIMSVAGPLANFALCLFAWVVLKGLLLAHVVTVAPVPTLDHWVDVVGHGSKSPLSACCMALTILVDLNLVLGLFNLMPVPPLDGAGILEGLAPKRLGPVYDRVRESMLLSLAALMIWWHFFDRLCGPIRSWVAVAALY